VISTNLVLQFPQTRNHFVEARGPNGLQHLKFVIKVLNADPPLVKGIVIALSQSVPHPFATLTAAGSEVAWLGNQ
jgi:hypothetical protein